MRGDSSLWLVCLCVELNGKLQSRTWRNLRLLFTPCSKKRPFSGAVSMLVSLEQSLAEPADSIIHSLSVFACVFQPMVHALKTTQPEELDPLPACPQKYNQRCFWPSAVTSMWRSSCLWVDLSPFEVSPIWATRHEEWMALEGVCVTEWWKLSLLPLHLLEEEDKRGEFVHIVVT